MSGPLSPLRRRAYGQLLVGQFLSNIGDGAFLVAVVTVMVVHRDSPRDLGIVLAVRSLVSLVGGGILADRFRRSRGMAVTDSRSSWGPAWARRCSRPGACVPCSWSTPPFVVSLATLYGIREPTLERVTAHPLRPPSRECGRGPRPAVDRLGHRLGHPAGAARPGADHGDAAAGPARPGRRCLLRPRGRVALGRFRGRYRARVALAAPPPGDRGDRPRW
jgi:hypothetical protein